MQRWFDRADGKPQGAHGVPPPRHGDPGWPSVAARGRPRRVARGRWGRRPTTAGVPTATRRCAIPSRFRRRGPRGKGRRALGSELRPEEVDDAAPASVRAAASALTAIRWRFRGGRRKSARAAARFSKASAKSEKSHRFAASGDEASARERMAERSQPASRSRASAASRSAAEGPTTCRGAPEGSAGGLDQGSCLPHLMASLDGGAEEGPAKGAGFATRRPTRSARGWRPAARSMPSGNSSGRGPPGRTAAPLISRGSPLPPGGAGMRTERVLDDHLVISGLSR